MHAPTPNIADTSIATRADGWLAPMVVSLFFAWGFATVMIDTLIPKLKALFELSYAEAMLTQFAFFLGYLVFSVPAGLMLARIGYLRQIVVGLGVMGLGCLMFAPAAQLGIYAGFLLALFVMAAGITTLQVAANPLIAQLGTPGASHARLNLAQAFNALGTTIGPLVGAWLLLADDLAKPTSPASPEALDELRRVEAGALQAPFLAIAAGLAVLAALFWLVRRSHAAPPSDRSDGLDLALLKRPRLAFGAVSIFLYVGAEVSIGSVIVNYLMQAHTLGAAAADAGRLVALYWGGAMVGRFIGSALLRHAPAGLVLGGCAVGAGLLACAAALAVGPAAAVAILAIGLFNSIMFPTIFSLAIEDLGEQTPQGSGLLCLAIVGGAIVPLLTGVVADMAGLSASLLAPAACYVWIAGYGWFASEVWRRGA